jgi:hypothetical protein
VTRGKKGQDLGPPQDWVPGRTLHSITEMRLTAEDISEAQQLLAVSDEQKRATLAEELQSIARRYWEQRRDSERPSAKWYRTRIGKVQKRAESLLKLLREPHGTGFSQLKFQTERHLGLPLLGGHTQEPRSIEQLLDDFVGACNACKFTSVKGAPEQAHIKTAVASLRDIWINFTGKKFPLNLQSADNRKDLGGRRVAERNSAEAFTSPGPRFVQVMMRKFDPNVPISRIGSALRDASDNDRRVD